MAPVDSSEICQGDSRVWVECQLEVKIHLTLCNLNPSAPADLSCELVGAKAGKITGRILTAAEMTAHNTFDQPQSVRTAEFDRFKSTEGGFTVTLSAKSVVLLEVE